MFRVWAVARHMVAESIRQKIALVGILLIAAILMALPFIVEGDGLTLASRVQSFLAYTLGSVGVILGMVTIFLSCLAISDEIVNKRIFMIASKPIPRWQFFVGKWVGIGILNAALLLACFFAVLFVTLWLSRIQTDVPDDREKLKFEVLSARHTVQPTPPDLAAAVASRVRQLREEGRFDDLSPSGQGNVRVQISTELQRVWRALPPGGMRRFEFKNLRVDRESEGFVHLRFKPTHAGGVADFTFPVVVKFGDLSDESTLTPEREENYPVEHWYTLPVPNYAINKDGTLYVMMYNRDPRNTFIFEGDDTFELLYDIGTFHWNLFRAMSIIWCRLAFLAALGLMMSTWLSFPVACMASFLVFAVASASNFLVVAMGWATPMNNPGGKEPLWILGPIIRPLANGFIWLVPDFSKFDAVDNVVNGRLVPLMWVIQTILALLILKGLVVGLLGCLILSKRELAGET